MAVNATEEKAKRELHSRGYLLKQRAFLKVYLITLAEKKRLYGLQFLDEIRENFRSYGYRPVHSEIYKALHELVDEGILKRIKIKKEGAKFQEVVIYQIHNMDEVRRYKKLLLVELERCRGLLDRALRDNF